MASHMQRNKQAAERANVTAKMSAGQLHIGDLLEVLCAIHLSSYVDSPYVDRGGLMIVGPPGVLKSSALGLVDKNYPDAVNVSDINARTLNDLRDQIAAKVIRTVVMPEYAKIWERHAYTAKNVEGTIRALAGEGWRSASFEDTRRQSLTARATFLSAMVPKFYNDRYTGWEESGFNRRFLWSLVRLHDPHLLDKKFEAWELVNFQLAHVPPPPASETIPNLSTREDRQEIRRMVNYQPGGSHIIQSALMAKILSVLKWWYRMQRRTDKDALGTLRRFSYTLGKEGADIII